MLQSKVYEITSTDDIELNIKRESKLEFKVVFDDKKPAQAVFVFLPGCGMDAVNDSYTQHIAEFVAKNYSVAVLLVNYHCIQNRHELGAKTYFDNIDTVILTQTCAALGISFDKCKDEQDIWVYLDDEIGRLKREGRFQSDKKLVFTASLQPTKNEYQNFGLMQALDILNALCFVRKNHAQFKLKKTPKTLLFGTSHGGYLALLCAKFAPWLIDGVVENSSYVSTCFLYILNKQIDYEKYLELTGCGNNNLLVNFTTKSFWTQNKNSPYFFSPAHAKIRSVFDEEHLKTSTLHHKPLYISYHSAQDRIALPQEKYKFYESLRNLGYNATLHLIKDESEIDGKFIKNLEHGMDMSIKMLIQKELPPLLAQEFKHEKDEKREISYPSENLEYHFKEAARGGGIDLMIKRLDDE